MSSHGDGTGESKVSSIPGFFGHWIWPRKNKEFPVGHLTQEVDRETSKQIQFPELKALEL